MFLRIFSFSDTIGYASKSVLKDALISGLNRPDNQEQLRAHETN